jgi:hypothetical protein
MIWRALGVSAVLAGCVSSSAAPAPGDDHWVRDIELSHTRGEVGRPFRAEVTWKDNYLTDVELAVTGLPEGLSFDDKQRSIVGKPARAGFFTVNVALRKQIERGPYHRPKPDERWWRGVFELEIYAPIE